MNELDPFLHEKKFVEIRRSVIASTTLIREGYIISPVKIIMNGKTYDSFVVCDQTSFIEYAENPFDVNLKEVQNES